MGSKNIYSWCLCCGLVSMGLLMSGNVWLLMRQNEVLKALRETSSQVKVGTSNESASCEELRSDDAVTQVGICTYVIYPRLSSKFGDVVTVRATVLEGKSKSHDLFLDVSYCNGRALPRTCRIKVHNRSCNGEVKDHVGEEVELVGYEGVESGGVPFEILSEREQSLQTADYYVNGTFVIHKVNR